MSPGVAVLERAAAAGSGTDHTSLWLLVAAGMVGFAAAWLVLELRRAWSPEALRDARRAARASAPNDDESVVDLLPLLVDQVAQLRNDVEVLRNENIHGTPRVPVPAETLQQPISIDERTRAQSALAEFQRIRAEQHAAQRTPATPGDEAPKR